jgi:predicted lipid-binding transport protein (Tim44 family)
LGKRVGKRVGKHLGQHLLQVPGAPGGDRNPREVEELLRVARLSFVQMQAAWDRADLRVLGSLATAPLFEDLRCQLAERGPQPNHTEVLSLEARLLRLEELQEAFVASVEFSGLIRERSDASAAPFRELWLLAKMKAPGQGWQLARVQSLS